MDAVHRDAHSRRFVDSNSKSVFFPILPDSVMPARTIESSAAHAKIRYFSTPSLLLLLTSATVCLPAALASGVDCWHCCCCCCYCCSRCGGSYWPVPLHHHHRLHRSHRFRSCCRRRRCRRRSSSPTSCSGRSLATAFPPFPALHSRQN